MTAKKEKTQGEKPWVIRDVDAETRTWIRMFALSESLTVAGALRRLVDIARRAEESQDVEYQTALHLLAESGGMSAEETARLWRIVERHEDLLRQAPRSDMSWLSAATDSEVDVDGNIPNLEQ